MSKLKKGDMVEVIDARGCTSNIKVGEYLTVHSQEHTVAPYFERENGELVSLNIARVKNFKAKLPKSIPNCLVSMDGGGKRYNKNKPRVDLLVPEALEAESLVWGKGAEKYAEHNWRRGMKWSVVIGSLLRHIFAIMKGEDIDSESGQLHAAHIKCNATMLIYYYYYYKQGDDRFKRSENE